MKRSKMEQEKTRSYHFFILGFSNFKKILAEFDEYLRFYRLEHEGKVNSKEIVYDVPTNMLSDAGVVISKMYENNKASFKVRKLSSLKGDMRRPSKKFLLGECEQNEEPRNFSLDIATAIENSFSTPFTVDLDAFVKQTVPKIEIRIEADQYNIIGGTGYRAKLLLENVRYIDVKSGKKVDTQGITLILPQGIYDKDENEEVLKIVDTKINELALNNFSRFELARQALYPKAPNPEEKEETNAE